MAGHRVQHPEGTDQATKYCGQHFNRRISVSPLEQREEEEGL